MQTPKQKPKNKTKQKTETPATSKQQGGGSTDGRDLTLYKERNDKIGRAHV